ncbi:MAG: hypothetical protein GY810_10090 [Aureispira sp.]|nr:hypothetical protein [Aureispira sp.]
MKAPQTLLKYSYHQQEFAFQKIFNRSYSLYSKTTDSGQSYEGWEDFAQDFFSKEDWFTAQPLQIDSALYSSILEHINQFKKQAHSKLSFAEHKWLYAWEGAIYDGGKNIPIQLCSNCAVEVPYFARYPKSICSTCITLLTDEKGQQVDYGNTHAMGYGVQGVYKNSKENYNSLDCFIGAKKFRAGEHRFGGVVVQLQDHSPK